MKSIYSRRTFHKVALAALPISNAFAENRTNFGGVQIGIHTYSFWDLDLDEAIAASARMGFGSAEIFSRHVEPGIGGARRRSPAGGTGGPPYGAPGPGPAREELRQWRLTVPMTFFTAIRDKFRRADLPIYSYYLSFRDDWTDPEIERAFEMAKALGIRVITASANRNVIYRVAPIADKHKIMVGLHTHADYDAPDEFSTPETVEPFLALSPYIGINLDIGHMTAGKGDPLAFMERHHDRITNLHLKDRKRNKGPNVPWGQGDTPIKEVLLSMKRNRYKFPAMIEYEYDSTQPSIVEIQRCVDYCREILI